MATELSAPPALSTPAENTLEQHVHIDTSEAAAASTLSDEEFADVYEVARTVRELLAGGWKTIGLQFPDSLLRDAPRVVDLLRNQVDAARSGVQDEATEQTEKNSRPGRQATRIYILADTSYSSCCVDEIAAEHVDADVVVHYGRSCLSPTSRLPVIYVFTRHQLDHNTVIEAFEKEFSDRQSKVVLMADVTRQDHVPSLTEELLSLGYENLLSTAVVHNPMGSLPNRVLMNREGNELPTEGSTAVDLQDYSVFHISDPPTALLLALSSRVQSLHILPTPDAAGSSSVAASTAMTTRRLLGRRYARLLSLATAGTIGILVNTLSVANYLASINNIRAQISAAGKKSYTVVVGKLNPAKLANFAEIDGWVVVGCWESSLVEDDGRYFRPVITPFELEAALAGDDKRVWGGEWWGGIEGVKAPEPNHAPETSEKEIPSDGGAIQSPGDEGEDIDEEESEPPEFDLRTGKLVSHSRPMRRAAPSTLGKPAEATSPAGHSTTLAVRGKSELATVKGIVSPGAEYLRSQRTWQGLGSDFDTAQESTAIEEGRSGVARGYTVGESDDKT